MLHEFIRRSRRVIITIIAMWQYAHFWMRPYGCGPRWAFSCCTSVLNMSHAVVETLSSFKHDT